MVGRLPRSSSGRDSVSWVCHAATAMDWSKPRRAYSATSLFFFRQNVAPGQLRNRLFRNWAFREGLGKELHGEKVPRRQSAHVREGFLKVGGKAVDDFGSPIGFLLAGENDFPGVPIRFDHNGIGRENGTDAGVAEVGLDLLKSGCVGLR